MAHATQGDTVVEKAAGVVETVEDIQVNKVTNWMEIPVHQLKHGMQIVTAINRAGKAVKSKTIKELVFARGCLNIHVNGNDCYDVGALVEVRAIRKRSMGTRKVMKEVVFFDGTETGFPTTRNMLVEETFEVFETVPLYV